jgi:hypothetical protein
MAKTDTKKEDEKQYDTEKKVSPLVVGKEAAVRTNERGVLNMAERLMKKPKYYAEGGETKSSRTKLLEGMPKNFMQEMATKVSKKLDSVGIKQEKEYEGKTKEEVAVKKAKGGSIDGCAIRGKTRASHK